MNEELLSPIHMSLLIALYKEFDEATNTNGQFSEHDIVDLRRHNLNPGIARVALGGLVETGFLSKGVNSSTSEKWAYWEFTFKGAELVERLMLELGGTDDLLRKKSEEINGGDLTDLSNISEQVLEVKEQIKSVQRYIETNNELILTSEQRSAALLEVRGFQDLIDAKFARTAALANAITHNGIFKFLKEKVPDKIVGSLISTIISSIAKWLGL